MTSLSSYFNKTFNMTNGKFKPFVKEYINPFASKHNKGIYKGVYAYKVYQDTSSSLTGVIGTTEVTCKYSLPRTGYLRALGLRNVFGQTTTQDKTYLS